MTYFVQSATTKQLLFFLILITAACGPNSSPDPISNDQADFADQTANPYLLPSEENQDVNQAMSHADIIFYNGKIHTMDPDNPVGEAIAIRKDLILGVGGNAEMLGLADSNTQVIDLQGLTVLPGLNDSHSHLLGDYELVGIPSLEDAIQEALRLGYTSISEMFANEDRLNAFIALDRADNLPIRINAYLPVNFAFDRFGAWYQAYEPGLEYSPFLRIAGVKVFLDNGDYGKKFLTEEYVDNPGYLGEVYWTQDELNTIIADVHQQGYQVAVHTCGDGALDMVLQAFDHALAGSSNEAFHHRIEHVMIARDDQMIRLRDSGLIASVQLSFFHSDWKDEFESTLGPERAFWVGRWRDLIDAGVPVLGSTDAPYGYGEVRSPLKAIYQAVTRIGEGGTEPAEWMLNQRITIEDSLDLLTLKGAYGTFQDPIKGSLTAGKYADMIILSADPLEVDPEALLEMKVWLTMVGGQSRYCASGHEALCP